MRAKYSNNSKQYFFINIGNPLNICIGIFDKDGNWVNENLLGEPILDGITQVSLYQGKAEFPRLLFNEISSNFPK